jgi:hypothetical protein
MTIKEKYLKYKNKCADLTSKLNKKIFGEESLENKLVREHVDNDNIIDDVFDELAIEPEPKSKSESK